MSYKVSASVLADLADPSGWRASLGQVARSAQAPRVATALLGLVLAIGIVQQAAGLVTPPRASGEASASLPVAASPVRRVRPEAIAAAHLFGVATPAGAPNRGPAMQDKSLILTGTVAGDDTSKGYAFIGTAAGQTHFYTAGQPAADGMLLLEVYTDHVVIERAGRRLIVSLPRRLDLRAPAAAPGTEVAEASAAPHEPTTGEMTATLQNESSRLAGLLTEKPYFLGDKLIGVQIEAGSSADLLAQLGLQPDDILKSVDGVLITPERLEWLRTHLASGEPVRLAGTRPGQGQFNVTVKSGTVAGMIAP